MSPVVIRLGRTHIHSLILAIMLYGCNERASIKGPARRVAQPGILKHKADDDYALTKEPAQIGPLALIYRGPAGCAGCSSSVARLLMQAPQHFRIRYVGPNEPIKINRENLRNAALYVQPGGDGTVEQGFEHMKHAAEDLREFIKSGGRYLGICMGGYLAGTDPGFNLLPGDSNEYITSPGASVTTAGDTIVRIKWHNGDTRMMYFQDGPFFTINSQDPQADRTKIFGYYASNNEIAALVAPFGAGKVGVIGPHTEAPLQWYKDYNLLDPDGVEAVYGLDVIKALME